MKNLSKTYLVIISLLLLSCVGGHDKKGDRLCTTEYRTITITVKDSQNRPVLLDDYYVKKTSTGEVLDFAAEDPFLDSLNRVNGAYIIMTDGKMWMTSTSGTNFEFHGILDSAQVINASYLIGNDECHVILYSGPDEIIILN